MYFYENITSFIHVYWFFWCQYSQYNPQDLGLDFYDRFEIQLISQQYCWIPGQIFKLMV